MGIVSFALLIDRFGPGRLDPTLSRQHLLGIGMLLGIGFTVSLFIAELAFSDPALTDTAKIVVLAGSLLAGTLGALTLAHAGRAPARPDSMPLDRPATPAASP